MDCHCGAGGICEQHPDGPGRMATVAHLDALSEPGVPWWRGPKRAALDTSDWTPLTRMPKPSH